MKLKYHIPTSLITNSFKAFSGSVPTPKAKKWKLF